MKLLTMFKQKPKLTHDDLAARIESALQSKYWKLFEKRHANGYVIMGDQLQFDRVYRENLARECSEGHRGHRYFVVPDAPLMEEWDYLAGVWTHMLGINPTQSEKGKIRWSGEDTYELWLPCSMYVVDDKCAFNFVISPSEKTLRTASNLSSPVEYWRHPFTPTIYLGLREKKQNQ